MSVLITLFGISNQQPFPRDFFVYSNLPRTDRVDADLVLRHLRRYLLNKATDSIFRGSICGNGLGKQRPVPCGRRNTDDTASLPMLDHFGAAQLQCVEDTIHLDGEGSQCRKTTGDRLEAEECDHPTFTSIVSSKSFTEC